MRPPQNESAELKRRLGIAAYKAGRIKHAIGLLGEAVELDPHNAEIHANYAVALHRKYELTRDERLLISGIAHLQRFIELSPNDPRKYLVYAHIGDICNKLGWKEESRGYFKMTHLLMDPSHN